MGLSLNTVSLIDFRSWRTLLLSDIGPMTVLLGPNAVGKTNVLEAVQLLCAQTSFRHAPARDVIRHGAHAARIEASCSGDGRSLDFSVYFEDAQRVYSLNGKRKQPSQLRGILPAISFTPDDLAIAKRASGVRRDAIDSLGAQLNKNYYLIRKDYDKVVRYKRRLLKEEASLDLVESINASLVTCGAQLFCYRAALLSRLAEHAVLNYAGISSGTEKLAVSYDPSWNAFDKEGASSCVLRIEPDEAREHISRALNQVLVRERSARRCLVGPHADCISFLLDGHDAADFGSQGQQRSVVLAWKMAEVSLVKETCGQYPVLLLDDVMSELDAPRRKAFMKFLGRGPQTIVTTTNLGYFDEDALATARVVDLSDYVRGDVL